MNHETKTENIAPDLVAKERMVSTEDVFLQMFRSFEPELLGMLFHVLGNIEDARDAMQDAFIRCWNRRESLHEIQNIKAWVFRISYNISLDYRKTAWHKRRQAMPEDDANTIVSKESPPEMVVQRAEEIAKIRNAIQTTLDEEERTVFLLKQNGEMTFEQIAQTLEIPIGTAKTRMRRAVMKLHQQTRTLNNDD